MRGFMKNRDMSYSCNPESDLVITHPDNRHGEMLRPINVWDLLELFVAKGWVWSETALALAGEIPPNEDGAAWRERNRVLVDDAQGLLPPFKDLSSTRIAAVVNSHTTSVLRLANAAVGNAIAAVPDKCTALTVDNYLSRQRIIEACPSIEEPLEKGLV